MSYEPIDRFTSANGAEFAVEAYDDGHVDLDIDHPVLADWWTLRLTFDETQRLIRALSQAAVRALVLRDGPEAPKVKYPCGWVGSDDPLDFHDWEHCGACWGGTK